MWHAIIYGTWGLRKMTSTPRSDLKAPLLVKCSFSYLEYGRVQIIDSFFFKILNVWLPRPKEYCQSDFMKFGYDF